MNKLKVALISFIAASSLLLPIARGQVTLPFTFSPSSSIQSSQVNADFSAVANEINAHENATNPHQTSLQSILGLNNSCGPYAINFNGNQAIDMEVENLALDPTPGNRGRIFINTTDGNIKYDNGTTIITIAGSGINNLTSVLTAGNSSGANNIDLNENQLLHGRAENLASDPSVGNAGRLYYNTASKALKVDSGIAWTAIGGSQGLSSVLGVSNSAGPSNVDFNQNQAKNMALDNLASDPGSPVAGQAWYNTTSHIPKFFNGTSSLAIGNTNTLAQSLALGNSAGSTPIDFNGQQSQHMVLWNNSGSPGTGTPGYVWFDTGTSQIYYETSGANHAVCSVDQTQTITNHTISGSANTLTNIQDASLSTNVGLLNGSQSITGTKTFTAAPIMGAIKNSTGDTITVPTGTGTDTLAYLNAAQILSGKTLSSPIFSGSANFNENQALSLRTENVLSLPAAGNPGRVVFNVGGQSLAVDNGTTWFSVAGAQTLSLSQVLSNGNSAGSYNLDLNENQALNFRLENLASAPASGNAGRVLFNTVSSTVQLDMGTSIRDLVDTGSVQTLTNKTLTSPTITTPAISGSGGLLTLPVGPETLVGRATADTLTNKTLTAPVIASIVNTGTLSLPTSTDTLVGRVTTDILTNKSISGATNTLSNIPNSATTAVSAKINNSIVTRDGSGAAALDVTGNVTGNLTGNASTVTTNANLTGPITSVGNATSVAAQTGTGSTFVMNTSPTLVTPALGTPSALIGTNITGTAAGLTAGTATTLSGILAKTLGGTGISSTATFPATGVVVTEAAAEVITNKDIDGGTASNTSRITLPSASSATLTALTRKTGTIAYDTTQGKAVIDNGSALVAVGAGGGGGVNFISQSSTWQVASTDDRDLETSIGNWLAFANPASTLPTNLTGGTPSVTCTRSTVAPAMDGTAWLEIVKGASNRQGDGCSVVFNVQPAYQGQTVTIAAPMKIASGSIIQGDVKFFVYDVTNSQLITPDHNDIVVGPMLTATFPTTASAATPANQQYRLGIYFASTATTAVTLHLDDVSVSPGQAVYGAAGSNTVDETGFTFSGFGTVTSPVVKCSRALDRLSCDGYFVGGTAAASLAQINFPSKYTMDAAKLGSRANSTRLGYATPGTASATPAIPASYPLFYDGTTTNVLFFAQTAGSAVFTAKNGNNVAPTASGDLIGFNFNVPIVGWDANVSMANSSTKVLSSYLANGTRVTGGPPLALGQYRALIKTASSYVANIGSWTDTLPTVLPNAADGFLLYSGNYTSAGTSGQPNAVQIYIGTNKPSWTLQAWDAAAHTTGLDVSPQSISSSTAIGLYRNYDPKTGVLTIASNISSTAISGSVYFGSPTYNLSGYIDVTASDNALSVGMQMPRSDVWLDGYSGYGSSSTRVFRWTNIRRGTGTAITYADSSTDGSKFTVNEDGLYSVSMNFGLSGATSDDGYIAVNPASLTAAPAVTERICFAESNGNYVNFGTCSATVFLSAGSVIRTMSASGNGLSAQIIFRMTKVSN